MLFGETFGKHVLHEEVDLINRVELSQTFTVSRLLFCNLSEIAEPQRLHILVLVHIIKCSLFPSVLDVPVHLTLGPLFQILFIFDSVGVVTVLSKFGLLFLELRSLGEHVRETREDGATRKGQQRIHGVDMFGTGSHLDGCNITYNNLFFEMTLEINYSCGYITYWPDSSSCCLTTRYY